MKTSFRKLSTIWKGRCYVQVEVDWSGRLTSIRAPSRCSRPSNPIPNPLFNLTPPPPSIGGPFVEAVPTGIAYSDGQLLVTLFTGFPFPVGASVVEQVDPLTGSHTQLITGLKAAIDVLSLREHGDIDHLVLQHAFSGTPPLPPFNSPGRLLRFETAGSSPTVIADCLTRPTSMTLDEKTSTLYVTEFSGRLVAIPVAP